MKTIKANYKLIILLTIMSLISLISLYNADSINDSINGIIFKQIIWYLIGIVIIVYICIIKNKVIYDSYKFLYIISIILLLLLLIFAPTINNAKCWFKIPGIGTFQPSEFVKIVLIITISLSISKKKKNSVYKGFKEELKLVFYTLLILFIPSVLTFLEPDTGAVLMYVIATLFILFIAGINRKWFIISFLSLIFIITFILVLYFFNINLFIKILGNSFFLRVERLTNWINKNGMQLRHGIIAIANGGLFGQYGTNDLYFPEAHTDFIFAVFASNFGYIGCLFLIFVLTLFDLELISTIKSTRKKHEKYIVSGFLGLIMYQQIQNIGMTFGLLPITGITLPFISYGGSSLVSYMIMIGIIMNINNDIKKYHN